MKIEETMLMTRLYEAEQGKKTAFEDGRKAEYDAFWDSYQKKGQPMNYAGLFAGIGWTVETFRPKYNLTPTNMNEGCFTNGFLPGVDFTELLQSLGLRLDTSNCTGFYRVLLYSCPKRFPEIDCTKATNVNRFCSETVHLETIDKIILPLNKDVVGMETMFVNNSKLKNIVFEGVIEKNFGIINSPLLTKDTINSVINALSDTTTGLTVTLSLTAVNNAFETSAGASDGSTSEEWTTLIATKSNWTIALA